MMDTGRPSRIAAPAASARVLALTLSLVLHGAALHAWSLPTVRPSPAALAIAPMMVAIVAPAGERPVVSATPPIDPVPRRSRAHHALPVPPTRQPRQTAEQAPLAELDASVQRSLQGMQPASAIAPEVPAMALPEAPAAAPGRALAAVDFEPVQPSMPVEPMVLAAELSVVCPERPPPVYPLLSRRLGEAGSVVLRVELNESGRVRAAMVHVSSGHVRLDEAALKAVRGWVCVPAIRQGRPARAAALQPFRFVVREP